MKTFRHIHNLFYRKLVQWEAEKEQHCGVLFVQACAEIKQFTFAFPPQTPDPCCFSVLSVCDSNFYPGLGIMVWIWMLPGSPGPSSLSSPGTVCTSVSRRRHRPARGAGARHPNCEPGLASVQCDNSYMPASVHSFICFNVPTIPDNRLIKPNYGRHWG